MARRGRPGELDQHQRRDREHRQPERQQHAAEAAVPANARSASGAAALSVCGAAWSNGSCSAVLMRSPAPCAARRRRRAGRIGLLGEQGLPSGPVSDASFLSTFSTTAAGSGA